MLSETMKHLEEKAAPYREKCTIKKGNSEWKFVVVGPDEVSRLVTTLYHLLQNYQDDIRVFSSMVNRLESALEAMTIENARLESDNETLVRERADEVWVWQETSEDHLDDIACPILIRPEQLRALLDRGPEPVRQSGQPRFKTKTKAKKP